MKPAGGATGGAGNRARWSGGDEDEVAEADEIRHALGVESAFGYHVEGGARRGAGAIAAAAPGAREGGAPGRLFPCLVGHDYTGCLGLGCPLETCWTGTATVSFARKLREESHVSTALYLPGAPCHTCAHLVEDEVAVPAPRTPTEVGSGPEARATLRRVTCGQGLWLHPISLASFVTRRIPMIDQDEPGRCPGYAPRPEPHPAVVAHLQRRRERLRLRRAEQRGSGAG